MGTTTRRGFMQALGAGVASMALPPFARAAAGQWGAPMPEIGYVADTQYKILEVFHVGGLSFWETFWLEQSVEGSSGFVDTSGNPVSIDAKGAEAKMLALPWSCDSPPEGNRVKSFGQDESGRSVYWGPATQPLWDTLAFENCRMVAMAHTLDPHDAAVPFAITGSTLGGANFAGLGAALDRRHRAQLADAAVNDPLQAEWLKRPFSYVLAPNPTHATFRRMLSAFTATGSHGGQHRPLWLDIGPQGLGDALLSQGVTSAARNYLAKLRGQYRQQMRWQGIGDHIRSKGYEDYRAAQEILTNGEVLHGFLGGDAIVASPGDSCTGGKANLSLNRTTHQLDLAAMLLNDDIGGARYVSVIDGGFEQPFFAGYDTHDEAITSHTAITCGGVHNVAQKLAQLISDGSIDLEDTMIIINTEFGRSVSFIPETDSRDYHGYRGYLNLLIGGPITGRSIAGSLDDNGMARTPGYSVSVAEEEGHSPADTRGAALMAAGINPFAEGLFAVSSFSPSLRSGVEGTELEVAQRIRSRILGVPS
ncbi:MAG: DUF1501 domain-containing protein [Bradymonadia bacterium]